VVLCPQPATIAKMRDIPGAREAGMPARFLLSVPVSRMGYRQSILASASVRPDVTRAYGEAVGSLLERYRDAGGADGASPRVLRLSAEALSVLDAWQRELEPRLRLSGDLRDLADWCGKLRRAHVVRIAAVLHLAHEAAGADVPEIGAERMLDAVALARDYLIPHARKAFALFDSEAGRQSMLVPLLAAITKAGAAGLTRSECGAVFHRHRSSAEVGEALAELEREGLVRRSMRPTTGRHAEVWVAATSEPR
jgi:hypothetical protein